jgi:hypothetical protein
LQIYRLHDSNGLKDFVGQVVGIAAQHVRVPSENGLYYCLNKIVINYLGKLKAARIK